MKRFLGIVCVIYSLLIIYVWYFDLLKNYLAPNLQIYLKASLFLLLLMGIILLFNKKINYKFKITDLFLLIPIIAIVLTGDSKLSFAFINNKMISNNNAIKKSDVVVVSEEEQVEEEVVIEEENKEETHDFSKVDFPVIDDSYSDLANYITFAPKADRFQGMSIRVRGFVSEETNYVPEGYLAFGKIEISCCAADATFIGFIIKKDDHKLVKGNWYEIEGILEKTKYIDGTNIMAIKIINIKDIDGSKEEQYVYPCYAYDNGACKESSKYDLIY